MRKLGLILVLGAGLLGVAAWFLTMPRPLPGDAFAGLEGDAEAGRTVFWASGCASCHTDPEAESSDAPVLSGGYRMESPFGTFIAPNISPGEMGIAGWSAHDLGNALLAGVSKSGRHLYPSLPYTSYRRMEVQDVADLKAFLDTLPVSDRPSAPHEVGFPFSIRRGLGLWKTVNLTDDWYLTDGDTEELQRGRYLVEALGHCAECHTPRDAIGGLDRSKWMQGAPNPSGKGTIPAITPGELGWSATDIAYYLETGFTPEYDSAGGQMTKVIASLSKLEPEDREAIAAYLLALP